MGKRGGKLKDSKSKAKNPQSLPGRKVGIVCDSVTTGKNNEIKLYVVDIDEESHRPRGAVEEYAAATPVVRFILPNNTEPHGVCVLESTVYIFAGYHHYGPDRPKIPQKYAKKFVLSEVVKVKGDVTVEVAQLVGIADMNYTKSFPRAIPTPDGRKILVFGGNILVEKSFEAFELYDLQSGILFERLFDILVEVFVIFAYYISRWVHFLEQICIESATMEHIDIVLAYAQKVDPQFL